MTTRSLQYLLLAENLTDQVFLQRSKGRVHLLRFTIIGQTVILGFAWGLVGAILFQEVIALPDQVVRLIVEYPTVLTLVVTLIATALSIITSVCVPSTCIF